MAARDAVLDAAVALHDELEAFDRDSDPIREAVQLSDWSALLATYEFSEPDPAMRACDHVAATIAGLAGGVLDLSRGWNDVLTSKDLEQRLVKVYKKRVREATGGAAPAIDNKIGGGFHRMYGPTHDIGRLWEAIQAVRSGTFRSAAVGHEKVRTAYHPGMPSYARVDDPVEAFLLLALHWASDFFSKLSLPKPGWTRLVEGEDRELARTLVTAYRKGENLRSEVSRVLSDLSGVALISLVLRIYRYLDMFVVSKTHDLSVSALGLGKDLRFRWMVRNANLVSFGLSTGRAFRQGNPFALNHAAFFKFWQDARAVEGLLDGELAALEARVAAITEEELSWTP